MRGLYLSRVVSLRVFKRGKGICNEKCPSQILLCRRDLPQVLLRMKAVHLPILAEIPDSIHGYLLYKRLARG